MRQSRGRRPAAAGLLGLALFAVVMALLPNGATTLDALGGVLAQPVVQLLLVVAVLGYVPWWLRKKE